MILSNCGEQASHFSGCSYCRPHCTGFAIHQHRIHHGVHMFPNKSKQKNLCKPEESRMIYSKSSKEGENLPTEDIVPEAKISLKLKNLNSSEKQNLRELIINDLTCKKAKLR